MAAVGPPDWGPGTPATGTSLKFEANTRYHVLLRATGSALQGKIWPEGTNGAVNAQVNGFSLPRSTGRGVGFYVYGTTTPTLESIRVTPL